MRTKRSIRNRVRRERSNLIDIDITSLLDILVILLVFLLKSYNSSGVVLNVPKGIELPLSASENPNTSGVIVQVSPTTIYVDDEVIFDSTAKVKGKVFDQGGKRIIPLYNRLVEKKEEIKRVSKQADAKKFSGVVNLVVDKSLKYNFVKKLLYTSAEAGFVKYKFVVLGEE